MVRIKAILYCFKYGILPFWAYERECHYSPMTYWEHLGLNMQYAWRWLTFSEDSTDREFEKETNHNF